jgi:hypothetical protein
MPPTCRYARNEHVDGLDGQACGERDLRVRAQHVLGIGRESARLGEQVERRGWFPCRRLRPRLLQQRLYGGCGANGYRGCDERDRDERQARRHRVLRLSFSCW